MNTSTPVELRKWGSRTTGGGEVRRVGRFVGLRLTGVYAYLVPSGCVTGAAPRGSPQVDTGQMCTPVRCTTSRRQGKQNSWPHWMPTGCAWKRVRCDAVCNASQGRGWNEHEEKEVERGLQAGATARQPSLETPAMPAPRARECTHAPRRGTRPDRRHRASATVAGRPSCGSPQPVGAWSRFVYSPTPAPTLRAARSVQLLKRQQGLRCLHRHLPLLRCRPCAASCQQGRQRRKHSAALLTGGGDSSWCGACLSSDRTSLAEGRQNCAHSVTRHRSRARASLSETTMLVMFSFLFACLCPPHWCTAPSSPSAWAAASMAASCACDTAIFALAAACAAAASCAVSWVPM